MSSRAALRCSTILVWLLICLIGFTTTASAAPIELDNNVDISWSDLPCFPSSGPQPPSAQPLCVLVDGEWQQKPAEELIQVVGAPRLVFDARNAGDLVDISVDFLDVSLSRVDGGPANGGTPLILNVFDIGLDPILRPGESVPLQLVYYIPASSTIRDPADDVFLKLGDFGDFNLLPFGDLIFTVAFDPRFALTDSSINRPDHVVTITVSGAGTTEVPEPGTLSLLLSGLAITALRARKLQG